MKKNLPHIPEFIIKENTFTYFSDLCLRCASNFTCIAASRIALKRDDYLLSLKHLTLETEAMLKGRERHEEYAKDIPTLEDFGYQNYVKQLKDGNEVVLKEVRVCTMLHGGLRGIIDILKIKREVNELGAEYHVIIQENKSNGFSKMWFYQLATYGIIMSTPQNYFHFRNGDFEPVYIDDEPIYNITAYICMLQPGFNFFPSVPYMVRNKLSEWWFPYVMNIYRKAREKRKYHRRGIYLLDLPEEKPRQMFFGRRGLRKTPPPLPPKT